LLDKRSVPVSFYGALNGNISPDGKYYSYTKDKVLYVFKKNGNFVNKYMLTDEPESTVWTFDSKQIFVCIYNYNINAKFNTCCIDIQSGTIKQILKSHYYHPITINDNKKLFLLEDIDPKAPASDARIIQYDLQSKKAAIVKLPFINDLYIYEDFTVSPDGKIIIFKSKRIVYVINIINQKIIDTFKLPGNLDIGDYSWKSDGTYVIFAYYSGTEYGIYKYTLPKY
jgi:Tol biopolymer transport system component